METQEQIIKQNQSVVTVGDWIITMILMCIPIVNFIMLLIWAFSSSTPVSKANWAKASLIFMIIGFVLLLIFWGTFHGNSSRKHVSSYKINLSGSRFYSPASFFNLTRKRFGKIQI